MDDPRLAALTEVERALFTKVQALIASGHLTVDEGAALMTHAVGDYAWQLRTARRDWFCHGIVFWAVLMLLLKMLQEWLS